jgi:uncharacterized protein YebE (UPF0316 family)
MVQDHQTVIIMAIVSVVAMICATVGLLQGSVPVGEWEKVLLGALGGGVGLSGLYSIIKKLALGVIPANLANALLAAPAPTQVQPPAAPGV